MIPAGKREMAWILVSWIFKFFFLHCFFHQQKDKLDQIKEKIYWQRNYNLNSIHMTNPSHYFLTILRKNCGKKLKLVNRSTISQPPRLTTVKT